MERYKVFTTLGGVTTVEAPDIVAAEEKARKAFGPKLIDYVTWVGPVEIKETDNVPTK